MSKEKSITKFKDQFDQFRREKNLFQEGDSILAAISGGIDSIVMLHLLHDIREESNLSLSVVHFNHQLRKEESDRDAEFVIELSEKLNIPCSVKVIDVKSLSKDKGLLAAFSEGLDVHKATAAEIFSVDIDSVSKDQRRSAKAINFGLIYGMSAFGLAKQLGIGRADAQEYVERYFERYPGVRTYMDETRMLASEQGYVETLYGRRLYLPDIHASNGMLRKAAERTAINAPMQGTAADIIKQAMVDIDHWLGAADLEAKMVLQVHDELVFEVSETDVDLLVDGVSFRMISAASLDVPLVVDIGIGDNWYQAH